MSLWIAECATAAAGHLRQSTQRAHGAAQAHETSIRSMQYSHNGRFLLSTDDGGQVKYWKPNLELVKARRPR